jgi:hypothetical protein
MDVFITITVSTDVTLAMARSLGHTSPATYPVVKRWMEQTLESAMEDIVKTHIPHPAKARRRPVRPTK